MQRRRGAVGHELERADAPLPEPAGEHVEPREPGARVVGVAAVAAAGAAERELARARVGGAEVERKHRVVRAEVLRGDGRERRRRVGERRAHRAVEREPEQPVLVVALVELVRVRDDGEVDGSALDSPAHSNVSRASTPFTRSPSSYAMWNRASVAAHVDDAAESNASGSSSVGMSPITHRSELPVSRIACIACGGVPSAMSQMYTPGFGAPLYTSHSPVIAAAGSAVSRRGAPLLARRARARARRGRAPHARAPRAARARGGAGACARARDGDPPRSSPARGAAQRACWRPANRAALEARSEP